MEKSVDGEEPKLCVTNQLSRRPKEGIRRKGRGGRKREEGEELLRGGLRIERERGEKGCFFE